jgi:hypothetical protein
MQQRNKVKRRRTSAMVSCVADAKLGSLRRDYECAKTEIRRLKLELALVRDELAELTDATSDFVRFML